MAKKVEKTKKKKVTEVEEKDQPQILNTADNLADMIVSILTNIKEENYKMLITDKNLSYRQKMKLRSNMYVALSILKALNNLYECEEKAILDTTTYKRAMCVFKETNHKKLSSLLKEGRDSTIESYNALCDDIVKELDKLDESYTSMIVELATNEDGTTQYVLKQVPQVKLDEILLNTIKKLIKVRETVRRNQSKNNQIQVSSDFFRGENIIARMNETLDYFKEENLTAPFTNNMVRYILETLSIRFNIMKNPETLKPEKLEQLKEFNKIISKMDATSLINAASTLFEAHFDYTQLMHVYNELEDALSTHQHTKKLALLKELDTMLAKLQSDIKKHTTAFKKSLTKSNYRKLEEKLKTYSFIDNNNRIENDLEVEEKTPITNEEIVEENDTDEEDIWADDEDDDDSIYADDDEDDFLDEEEYLQDVETIEEDPEEDISQQTTKVVNSRKLKHETHTDLYDYDIPDLYDNDTTTIDTEKDENISKALTMVGSKKAKETFVKPSKDSINEMVAENTKTRTKKTTIEKVTNTPNKDYNNIGARLSKISGLLNKK